MTAGAGGRAPLLILFDIDGTLLVAGATGHGAALHVALERVLGIVEARRHALEYAGRTDLEIARELVALEGVTVSDEGWADLEAAWVSAYRELVEDDLSDRVALGMAALLERLAARGDVRLSLVTGNLEPIARQKLERAGIGHHFPAGQGAFGSDSVRRADLPPIARARAGGGPDAPWPRERTLVVGDTPRDIACARTDGLRVLGLAGGAYRVSDLGAADGVAGDVAELETLLEAELG